MASTLAVHVLAVAVMGGSAGSRRAAPPVYSVQLVAAPRPEPSARRAPEALQRPADRAVPVSQPPPRRRTSVAETPPPPVRTPDLSREPAPRTTPAEEPAPNEEPSTGTDVATVKTTGVDFPYPEYLRNLVAQVYRRWHRPESGVPLRAEVFFLVHRDGSVSSLQFLKRSGNFSFDLEAQGALEAAGNGGAFGELPDGYESDVLPVNFFFNPGPPR